MHDLKANFDKFHELTKQFRPFPLVFEKCRKRIEILFSQLRDQMMIKQNYAKTFAGLFTRTISKITAMTRSTDNQPAK